MHRKREIELHKESGNVKMVKSLKLNKAMFVLQGCYADRKVVIVLPFDDGTHDRLYGHFLVLGIKKYSAKVIKKIDPVRKMAKKSKMKAFVKLMNYQHPMPTR